MSCDCEKDERFDAGDGYSKQGTGFQSSTWIAKGQKKLAELILSFNFSGESL